MATKKQKREAALAKREEFMADVARTGLEAQRKDQQRRAEQKRRAEADAERRKQPKASKTLNEMFAPMFDDASIEQECI